MCDGIFFETCVQCARNSHSRAILRTASIFSKAPDPLRCDLCVEFDAAECGVVDVRLEAHGSVRSFALTDLAAAILHIVPTIPSTVCARTMPDAQLRNHLSAAAVASDQSIAASVPSGWVTRAPCLVAGFGLAVADVSTYCDVTPIRFASWVEPPALGG